MNNFKPFAESYLEVTIPLDSKMITAFEQSEQYAYLLEDFYRANANPAYDSVYLTMTVSFDFKSMVYTLRAIAFIVCIVLIIVIMWKLFKAIKEINILEEEVKMNLYDDENNYFVPNPPKMDYWEIITKIAEVNNISLTQAVDKYYDISIIPNSTCYCALIGCDEYLFPFGSEIIICENKDELISYGIQPQYAGKKGVIKGIYIDEERLCKDIELEKHKKYIDYLYYLISTDDSLFSCKILQKID